jgi:hypothetical protein
MQKLDKRKPDPSSEFAPALDAEPVFERPEVGRWDQALRYNDYRPGHFTPSGAWVDGRASFGLESLGGVGFVDPGSFALANHSSPMLQADGVPASAMESASMDLGMASSFDGGGGGGGGGAAGGGGGDAGGGF